MSEQEIGFGLSIPAGNNSEFDSTENPLGFNSLKDLKMNENPTKMTEGRVGLKKVMREK